jgi:hypothetical protein
MKRLLCSLLLVAAPAFALDNFYLGVQGGHVGGLTGANNAIGFGVDLGAPTGAYLDVMAHIQYSSHGPGAGISLFHPTFDAVVHLARNADFDLTLEAGPGFYFLSTAGVSSTKFGLNGGANGDVLLDETIRIGLGIRGHKLFDAVGSDSFYTVMMRIGYQFE